MASFSSLRSEEIPRSKENVARQRIIRKQRKARLTNKYFQEFILPILSMLLSWFVVPSRNVAKGRNFGWPPSLTIIYNSLRSKKHLTEHVAGELCSMKMHHT